MNTYGIKNPNYETNPVAEDKNQVISNLEWFIKSYQDKGFGYLIWPPSKGAYRVIKEFCKENKIVCLMEVGCGGGFGANFLHEAVPDIWAIDKNALSATFAVEAFKREGLIFSNTDILDKHTKDIQPIFNFGVIVAIEVIEHIDDPDIFIGKMKEFGNKKTIYFISSPNRDHEGMGENKPLNTYHVREWTVPEFREYLESHFKHVEILNNAGDPLEDDSLQLLMLAKCHD